jgi:hypothetical protein
MSKSTQDAILQAFTYDDLRRVLQYGLEWNLDVIVPHTANLEAQVFELLQYAQRQGKLLPLLRCLAAEQSVSQAELSRLHDAVQAGLPAGLGAAPSVDPGLAGRDCKITIDCADIVDFKCDVVVLKYAQSFYGADWAVANRISDDPAAAISPLPGQHILLPGNGKVAAKQVLFVGTPSLYDLGYGEIREFARRAMQLLSQSMPSAKSVGMTVHGPGFGLDETESFLAQIAGLSDAFRSGMAPALQQISIVEISEGRADRFRQVLEAYLPTRSFSRSGGAQQEASQARIEEAGRRSSAKPHIFVAMPFSEDMEDTYIFGIQGPVNGAGYLCERVDLTSFTGDILTRIKSRIETASLVIADLTGANPNVYLEVGYAWGKDRPTLLIAKKGDQLKFDVQSQRCLIYKSIADLAKRLASDLANLP